MTCHVGRRWNRTTRCPGVVPLICVLSCSSAHLEEDETDVVVTIKDHDRDYTLLRTYYLPHKVVDLCESGAGGAGGMAGTESIENCKPADHSLDDTILAELRSNLDALGYREIEDPEEEEPDVAFFVGLVAQDHWFLETAPAYCYDYYYYYWGCWYPSYSYAYNLPTSTIVIDMADVSAVREDEFDSAWTALLQGLQRTTRPETSKNRVKDAMARAFSQSPYLESGGER